MSFLPTLYTVARQRYTAAGFDAHGNPVVSWSAPEDLAVYGWSRPQSSEPKLAGEQRIEVSLEVFAPVGTVTEPPDRIEVDGELYNVVGETEDYDHGPFGWQPGVVINLKRWEG